MEPKKTSKKSSKTAEILVAPVTVTESPVKDSKPKKSAAVKTKAAKSSTAKTASPKSEAKRSTHRHSKLAVPPSTSALPVIALRSIEEVEVVPIAAAVEPVETAESPAALLSLAISEPPAALPINYQDVAKLAYHFWQERNYADGSAEEDWQRAEQALAAHS